MGSAGAINAQVCAIKTHWNFSQRMHPIDPIGPKTQVLVRFILFGCILDLFRNCMKLGAKRAELVQLTQNFMARTRIGIFGNERTPSTPLDPKLKYWFVSYYLGAFWICFDTARNSVQNG